MKRMLLGCEDWLEGVACELECKLMAGEECELECTLVLVMWKKVVWGACREGR